MSYLIAIEGVAHVTESDGTVSLVPGLPITTAVSDQALSPSLVVDNDGFYPLTVGSIATLYLLPAQVAADDSFNPPALGPTVSLQPALVSDGDAYFVALLALRPALVSDSDAFFASVVAANVPDRTLAPQLVIQLDSLFPTVVTPVKLGKEQRLRPRRVDSDDDFFAVSTATGPVAVSPALYLDADAIPAADCGWHLYVNTIVIDGVAGDVDGIYGPQADTVVFPATYFDEETIDGYPFRVQSLTGGVPLPPPAGLTGSLSQRRLLQGSLNRTVRLTGSTANSIRLTGSLSQPRTLHGSLSNRVQLTGSGSPRRVLKGSIGPRIGRKR
jgi:hypothetical protein